MKKIVYPMVFIICMLIAACEKVIEVDLGDKKPSVVIEADINDLLTPQNIYLSRTVSFSDTGASPISNAQVRIFSELGDVFTFPETEVPGRYQAKRVFLNANQVYKLQVIVDGVKYEASDHLNPYIDVDSIALGKQNFSNPGREERFLVNFLFTDSPNEDNYYRYEVSRNDEPYRFITVNKDLINDGLVVQHPVLFSEKDVEQTDVIHIRRSIISMNVFHFWFDIKYFHPLGPVPTNPRSNLSNGALGFFSVNSAKDYSFKISEFK